MLIICSANLNIERRDQYVNNPLMKGRVDLGDGEEIRDVS